MATIVSIRHHKPGHKEIWDWLLCNMVYTEYLIDRISVTFINDEDATAFCLRFGIQSSTLNPQSLNRQRE